MEIVWYLIAGLVIGAIARLILPGKQSMGWVLTMLIGAASAVIGGYLWEAVFPDNDGVAWIGSIIVAVAVLVIYERVIAKRAT